VRASHATAAIRTGDVRCTASVPRPRNRGRGATSAGALGVRGNYRSERTTRGDGHPAAALTSAGRREPIEECVRVHRLDIEPLHDRDLGAADDGEVVTARLGLAVRGQSARGGRDTSLDRAGGGNALVLKYAGVRDDRPESALAEQVLVDRDIGEVRLERGAEGAIEVYAREVAVGVGGELVAGRRREGLAAEPDDDRDRDQRHRELRVQPLHLERALGVRVQVERGLGTRTDRAAGDGVVGTGGEAGLTISDTARVAESRLAPIGVDLESEHCLGLPNLTDDVEPAAGTPIDLMVLVAVPVQVRGAHVLSPRTHVV